MRLAKKVDVGVDKVGELSCKLFFGSGDRFWLDVYCEEMTGVIMCKKFFGTKEEIVAVASCCIDDSSAWCDLGAHNVVSDVEVGKGVHGQNDKKLG